MYNIIAIIYYVHISYLRYVMQYYMQYYMTRVSRVHVCVWTYNLVLAMILSVATIISN